MTANPSPPLAWRDTTAHKAASALLVLGCAAVLAGLFLPWLRTSGVTGIDFTMLAARAIGKLGQHGDEVSKTPRAIVEVAAIVIVNGLCIGLFALAAAWALVKCVVYRRSATLAVALPVLLFLLSVGYATARLASLGEEGRQVLAGILAVASSRSGDTFAAGVGLYTYLLGMVAVLVLSTTMYRIERHAARRTPAPVTRTADTLSS